MSKTRTLLMSGTALLAGLLAVRAPASAKDLTAIGVTMGSLGNPYFVALTKGIKAEANAGGGSKVSVTAVSADYDLNKQFTQIDNFIAAGVQMIVLNAVDPNAILPAIKRAQAAGIVVVAADVAATGADATVETDNTLAGTLSCDFLAKKLGGKGNVVIQNGPQVSSVIDRVKGCKAALAKSPDIKILSSDQDGKGSRDGGLQVMQGALIRYPDLNGVFTINDPQAIGSDLAAKQQNRTGLVITSVDGAPDIVQAIKTHGMIAASASQDPYGMGRLATKVGMAILAGHPPADKITLMTPKLIDADNVDSYVGWTDH